MPPPYDARPGRQDGVVLTFHPASPDDVPAVVALVNDAFRGRDGWTTEADLLEGPRASEPEVHDVLAQLVLARDEDELVGCFVLAVDARTAHLGMVAVDPRRQASGTGRELLAQAERMALAAGCDRVEMTVLSRRTDLQDWYVRRGYARVGERRPFHPSQARGVRVLVDDLAFDVLAKPLP
jgi:ribosomal protein S18 acetylase RimI-like enzyme